jgi:predicted alpha/beta-hydrolase family hydrolase
MITPFAETTTDPHIRGFLHSPTQPSRGVVVLTHGAGANCQSKLLIEMSDALTASGLTVLRFDLPFRLKRPHGPPSPSSAAGDRDGLRRAVSLMKEKSGGPIFMGGHSYGGRQATILASEVPSLADALLLLSYPLHPPEKPAQLRTAHFPKLKTPSFFAHGTRDPFGTIAEMDSALKLIPAPHVLFEIEGAAHDLLAKKAQAGTPANVASKFLDFVNKHSL